MAEFQCHKCKYRAKQKGLCPHCNVALESACPVCGQEIDCCTCTGMIVSTKEPKQPH